MESEICVVGLCSFINLHDTDKSIIPATVIIPRAREKDDEHIPFIAYDSRTVTTRSNGFKPVGKSPFLKRNLESGTEVVFVDDEPGTPRILPSFAAIPNANEFWPRARSCRWKHEYVPRRFETPDPAKVDVLFRL